MVNTWGNMVICFLLEIKTLHTKTCKELYRLKTHFVSPSGDDFHLVRRVRGKIIRITATTCVMMSRVVWHVVLVSTAERRDWQPQLEVNCGSQKSPDLSRSYWK